MFVSKNFILKKKVAFGTAESLEIDAFFKKKIRLKIEGIENNS